MANVVANSCLVTHPPDKEQHYHWLCNGVFTQSNKANLRLNLLWFEFLMAVYFVVYLQVSKTAILFYCTLDKSWWARAPSEGVCAHVFHFRSISELSLLFFPSPHRIHHSAKPQDTSTFVTERRIFFFQQKKQIDVLPLTWLCKLSWRAPLLSLFLVSYMTLLSCYMLRCVHRAYFACHPFGDGHVVCCRTIRAFSLQTPACSTPGW